MQLQPYERIVSWGLRGPVLVLPISLHHHRPLHPVHHTSPLSPPPVSLSVPRPAPCPRPPSLFVAFPPRAHACVRASRPATMVAEGEPAPDFTATDCDGASFRLSAVTPGRPVVLYFYPKSYVLAAGLCGLVGWEWGVGGGGG